MTIRKIEENRDERFTLLRVTIPRKLLTELRETRGICRERGFVFDIKPDVRRAIEQAIAEAKISVKEQGDQVHVEP